LLFADTEQLKLAKEDNYFDPIPTSAGKPPGTKHADIALIGKKKSQAL
jgi:hypothetical protein